MRNIRLILKYDGSGYYGWQVQRSLPTIQGIVERALETITQIPVRLIGSGRTDAGVHAMNQAANFFTTSPLALPRLLSGVNALLPADIVVKEMAEEDLSFHARFSARGKVYLYRILNCKLRCPFETRRAWHISESLNLDALTRVSRLFLGKHDFSSFRAGGVESNPVREIRRLEISKNGDIINIEMEASGFLRQMVRTLVASLAEAGKGKLTEEQVRRILQLRDRSSAPAPAPAWGLYLKQVFY